MDCFPVNFVVFSLIYGGTAKMRFMEVLGLNSLIVLRCWRFLFCFVLRSCASLLRGIIFFL